MSLERLADTGLPFNRKERYFTGTVLPMLVCAHDFAHFGRLTTLAGLGPVEVDASPGGANVQFFTEYGFAESLFGEEAERRFPEAPTSRDTPDVLVYVDGPRRVLLAIEAKMYDKPTAAELEEQLRAQAGIVAYLRDKLGVAQENVAHVALLPAGLARRVGDLSVRTITWEDVLSAYADVGPPYFVEMLRVGLARYDALLARRDVAFGANAETKLSGEEIVRQFQAGMLTFTRMGRRGGLAGPELREDITSGAWRTFRYECSSKVVDNRNWFGVADFVTRVRAASTGEEG
ncbi:hypothetical protein [Polyangium jinanense]|uniref:Uncharacterized protein n=1 Tax=Polyangium jinanense TaxID=2829994 RepID=A0A9X3XBN7_9BACT|nr:hypothetical protein [Polyangium jinanense]MDC3958975.1 hypothetical protein [Polyangium jinanense]MDC3986400.1 hypothetical protein [Polyangium jinanense]